MKKQSGAAPTALRNRRAFVLSFGLLLLAPVSGVAGCERRANQVRPLVSPVADELAARAARDLLALRTALPEAAGIADAQLGAEFAASVVESQQALALARQRNAPWRALELTFVALAAPDGRIVAGDRNPDALSGLRLLEAFPPLVALTDAKPDGAKPDGAKPDGAKPSLGPVEALGVHAALRVVKEGNDMAYLQGVRVGKVTLYAGWSLRHWAHQLDQQATQRLGDTLKSQRVPGAFAFLLRRSQEGQWAAFGSPHCPDAMAAAISKLPVEAMMAKGGSVSLEVDRAPFEVALRSLPGMAELGVGFAAATF